ncbi:MAG: hypothetical protein KA369_20885 [Spirochaetes bacterium]|nr:hypothetical protein [Spirochaetota bacterium]
MAASPPLSSKKEKRSYVGNEACAACHGAEAIGDQHSKWLRTPHAKAFATLRSESAIALGKKLSIDKPHEDRACLKCHTTGGGRHRITREEGVGCEACHGPGSGYHEFANHVDTVDRQSAYETALKNGMYPILGIKNIKKREKLCLRCHSVKRPCFPAESKEIYRQSISLQVISTMKKGTLDMGHDLIPPFPQY